MLRYVVGSDLVFANYSEIIELEFFYDTRRLLSGVLRCFATRNANQTCVLMFIEGLQARADVVCQVLVSSWQRKG